MLGKLLLVGIEHRLATAFLLLALTVLAATGVPRARIDTSPDHLAVQSGADRLAAQRVAREFGSDSPTVVYVRDAALWTPAKLAALEQLHRRLAALPMVDRIDDLFTQRSLRSVDGNIVAGPLLPGVPADADAAAIARRNALADPLAARNLISADGDAVALVISRKEGEGAGSNREDFDAVEGALAADRGAFTEVFQVGPARTGVELERGLTRDLERLLPASAAATALVALLLFRNVFAALVPLATAALSLLWTTGMLGYAGIPVGILGAMLPPLVLAIAAIGSSRLMRVYREGLAASATGDRVAAVRFMASQVGATAALTMAMSAVGFAAIAVTGTGPVRDFARAAAFAILANGLITPLLVPMLLATAGPGRLAAPSPPGGTAGFLGSAASGLLRLMRWPPAPWLLGFAAVVAAALLVPGTRLPVANDPMSFLRQDRDAVRDADRLQREMAGIGVFHITLESAAERAFQDPPSLQKLADIQAFIAKQGAFDRSRSLADLLSLVNRELHDGRPEAFRVPATRRLVAQGLLFFEQRDLRPFVSRDFRRANIVVRHDLRDSTALNRHVEELRQVVRHVAGPEMSASVTGEGLMIHAGADPLLRGQLQAIAVLLGATFLGMWLMFTSWKGGFVALVPGVVTLAGTLVAMQLFAIPLNAGTAMVAVVAIGMSTDGALALLLRYNGLCRRTSDYGEALAETVRGEAGRLCATALALALGFGVLLFSELTPVAQFGALGAWAVAISVLANLSITPLVMSRTRLVGLHEILAMPVHRTVLDDSPLFEGMTPYQVRKAILISELHEVAPGARIIEQGTMGSSMYLVVSGQLDVVRRDAGVERRLALLKPGEVFGEIGFIRATRRTADVRAVGPVTVLRYDRDRLESDLRFFPGIVARLNFNISCILGRRLADLVEARPTE